MKCGIGAQLNNSTNAEVVSDVVVVRRERYDYQIDGAGGTFKNNKLNLHITVVNMVDASLLHSIDGERYTYSLWQVYN